MYFFKDQCKQEDNVMGFSDSTLSPILLMVDGNPLHYAACTAAF